MTRVFVALATGYLALRLLRILLASTLRAVVLQRPNYRARYLPTAVGVLIPVAMLEVDALRALAGAAGIGDVTVSSARFVIVFTVFAFAALGLLDDLVGDGRHQGFTGHGRALLHGRLTTGGLKLMGGAGVAVVAAAAAGDRGIGRLLVDALVVALAANLANLFDRAPGRVLKVSAVAYVPLAIAAGTTDVGIGLGVGMGAALGLFGDDLGERIMLGDAGANAIGALLGVGAVIVLAPGTRTLVLVGLAVGNALSERVSFSRVIERVGGLRFLDQLGRRRPSSAPSSEATSGELAGVLHIEDATAAVPPGLDEADASESVGEPGEIGEAPGPDEHGADPPIVGGVDERPGGDPALFDPQL